MARMEVDIAPFEKRDRRTGTSTIKPTCVETQLSYRILSQIFINTLWYFVYIYIYDYINKYIYIYIYINIHVMIYAYIYVYVYRSQLLLLKSLFSPVNITFFLLQALLQRLGRLSPTLLRPAAERVAACASGLVAGKRRKPMLFANTLVNFSGFKGDVSWKMIGLREKLQERNIFHGKIYGFL